MQAIPPKTPKDMRPQLDDSQSGLGGNAPTHAARTPPAEKEAKPVMGTSRLEAFSDGVIAVIITIMVLELKAPATPAIGELIARWHIFAAYGASFIFVAIFWVNHHHMLHSARQISAPTLWLNIHWLFWLSLYPFATNYVGETKGAPLAIAVYGVLAAVTATAYILLATDLRRRNDPNGMSAAALRRQNLMSAASILLPLIAVPLAYVSVPFACVLLVVPALIYFMPADAQAAGNADA